jgi:hypothetical protein
LTEDEVLARGLKAAAILNEPAHIEFYEELKRDTLACIGNTAPEDTRGREVLYYRHQGIVDLVGTLEQYKLAAEHILTQREQAPSTSQESDFD